jgi:hypothetical protein
VTDSAITHDISFTERFILASFYLFQFVMLPADATAYTHYDSVPVVLECFLG